MVEFRYFGGKQMRRLLIFLLSFFPSLLMADTVSGGTFTPVANDLSVQYLSNIFGAVDGVLHSAGSQIMGQIFGVFNAAILTLGGIIILYTLFVGTLKTAHEGEMLGRSWSSMWIPLRSVAGFALLVPKASGYSMIQIFIMWVIVQGVGAADTVWQTAVNYLYTGGSLIQPQSASIQNQGLVGTAGNILKMETCMDSVYNALVLKGINNPDLNISVAPFSGTLAVAGVQTGLTPPCYVNDTSARCKVPNAPDTQGIIYFPGHTGWTMAGQSGHDYYGTCGQVSWTFPLRNNAPDMGNSDSLTGAIQLMVLDLQPIAQSLANILLPSQSSTPGTSPQPCADNGAACAAALGTPQPNGTGWSGANANTLVQAATDYMAIRQPYITQQNVSNQQDAANTLYGEAYGQSGPNAGTNSYTGPTGWILAGSYYTLLAKFSSMNLQSDTSSISNTLNYSTFPSSGGTYNFPDLSNDESMALANTTYGLSVSSSQPPPTATNMIDNFINADYNAYLTTFGSTGGSAADIVKPGAAKGVTITGAALTAVGGGALGIPMALIGGMMWDIINHLNTLTQTNVDPIAAISSLGVTIVTWVQVIWVTGTVAIFLISLVMSIGSCMNPYPYAFGSAMLWFVPMLTALLLAMLGAGAVMAYYVPLIPFLLFLFTAIGWFISVIEAMVAAPLVALGIAHPEGQHEILGRAEPAIMLLTNVFMRPTLIIIGFIAASILVRIALWLLNQGFFQAVSGTPLDTGAGGLVAVAAIMVIYVWIVMEIIERCFALIHEVPARTLRWIQGQVETFGEEQAVGKVKGGMEAGMAGIRGGMEAGGPKVAGELGTAAGREIKEMKKPVGFKQEK